MKEIISLLIVALCLATVGYCQDRYVPHPLDQYAKPTKPVEHKQQNYPQYYPYPMPIYIPQMPTPPKFAVPEPPKAPAAPFHWKNDQNPFQHAPQYYAQPFRPEEFKQYMPEWLNAKPLGNNLDTYNLPFPQAPKFPEAPSPQAQYGAKDWNEFFKKQYPWASNYGAYPWGPQKGGLATQPFKSVNPSISESDYSLSGDESETI